MDTKRRDAKKSLAVAGLVWLALLLLLPVPAVWALESRGGEVVVIGANEVIDDDLYVAAAQFVLDGTVTGDLIVVGSTIEINGRVGGDVAAAGQSITINGAVQDDARLAGYALTVDADIGDDLVAAGFSLEQKVDSGIGGDLVYAGSQALLRGGIAGNAKIGGNAVELAGIIGGDADVDVGSAEQGAAMMPGFPFMPNMPQVPAVPAGLTIADSARIGGDLNYTARSEVAVPSGVVAGEVNFSPWLPPAQPQEAAPSPTAMVAGWFLNQVRRLLTLLLVGALLMWLMPGWIRQLAGIVEKKPLPSLGWGVLAIAIFLLLMAVIGAATLILTILLGVLTLGGLALRTALLGLIASLTVGFGFGLVWSYVTRITISLLLGQLVFRLFKSQLGESRWWPMVVGVVLFVAFTAIPVLGWLATLATILLGLGAVAIWLQDCWRRRKETPTAA